MREEGAQRIRRQKLTRGSLPLFAMRSHAGGAPPQRHLYQTIDGPISTHQSLEISMSPTSGEPPSPGEFSRRFHERKSHFESPCPHFLGVQPTNSSPASRRACSAPPSCLWGSFRSRPRRWRSRAARRCVPGDPLWVRSLYGDIEMFYLFEKGALGEGGGSNTVLARSCYCLSGQGRTSEEGYLP